MAPVMFVACQGVPLLPHAVNRTAKENATICRMAIAAHSTGTTRPHRTGRCKRL
jgi:hypothetical protein